MEGRRLQAGGPGRGRRVQGDRDGSGSYSYDTQIGGNTTVPQLKVDKIKQIGTTS